MFFLRVVSPDSGVFVRSCGSASDAVVGGLGFLRGEAARPWRQSHEVVGLDGLAGVLGVHERGPVSLCFEGWRVDVWEALPSPSLVLDFSEQPEHLRDMLDVLGLSCEHEDGVLFARRVAERVREDVTALSALVEALTGAALPDGTPDEALREIAQMRAENDRLRALVDVFAADLDERVLESTDDDSEREAVGLPLADMLDDLDSVGVAYVEQRLQHVRVLDEQSREAAACEREREAHADGLHEGRCEVRSAFRRALGMEG